MYAISMMTSLPQQSQANSQVDPYMSMSMSMHVGDYPSLPLLRRILMMITLHLFPLRQSDRLAGRMPAFTRIVTRGPAADIRSDVSSLELFSVGFLSLAHICIHPLVFNPRPI